jgi:hypothetical protein
VLSGAGLFTAPGITGDLAALVLFAPAEYSRAVGHRRA